MTTNDKSVPERIAIRWEPGQAVTNGLLMEHPDYTQYVRADLASAPVSLGKRVLEQRMANGLSLRELSEKTGVSYSVIARIERGECVQPTPRVSAALEDWLAAVPDSRLAKVEAAARLGLQMAEANDLWNTAETIRDALQPSETAGHPDDQAVDRFAAAMKAKLEHAREHIGRSGWEECTDLYLSELLIGHIIKANAGTFEDVANFAMMLHQNNASPHALAQAYHTAQADYEQRILAALDPTPVSVSEAAKVLLEAFTSDECATSFKPAWAAFCKALKYDNTIYQGMEEFLRALAAQEDEQ